MTAAAPTAGTVHSLPPVADGGALTEARFRRFGTEAADLDVDLARHGPDQVTRVIQWCVAGPDTLDRRAIDEMSIGDRIACLLLIARRAGASEFDVVVRCPDCGEAGEIDLSIDEILSFSRRAGRLDVAVDFEGGRLRFRCPTGADQAAWQREGFADAESARRGIVRSLALTPLPDEFPEATVRAIEQALEEGDPLVGFGVASICQACAMETTHEIELTRMALRFLEGRQLRLAGEVHRLAVQYGWSEEAILALPARRRARYISLIESGRV
jgi:hypothetical protein